MAHSYSRHYLHIVFGTKYRQKIIQPGDMELRLHKYIARVINNKYGFAHCVNGTSDHVHILMDIKTAYSTASMVRDVKAYSSGWINRTFNLPTLFRWQTGYGVFSVGYKDLAQVSRYIERQKIHHQCWKFESEYTGLLQEHAITFQESDLWK